VEKRGGGIWDYPGSSYFWGCVVYRAKKGNLKNKKLLKSNTFWRFSRVKIRPNVKKNHQNSIHGSKKGSQK
jgi:hypothetical protein